MNGDDDWLYILHYLAFDCTPLIAQFADLSERLYNGDLSIIAFVKAIRRGFMEYSKSVVG